jgi:hypothetical protein
LKAKGEVISQEELKRLLEYDPITGDFTWLEKASKHSNIVIGSIADKFHAKYKDISINNKRYKSHRLVWLYLYGEFPTVLIDHIDGNTLNNRADNLRLATSSKNNWNRTVNSNSSTGVKGVRIHKNGNYEARIMCNKVSHYLGVFETLEEASRAVESKRQELHGEFANNG